VQRVSLFIELLDDEAERVIGAISETDVRFAGLRLGELLRMTMQVAEAPHSDAAILHTARSAGAVYAGAPAFEVVRRGEKS